MTNKNYIEVKRESLTSFIQEQLIGPGAYKYKFGRDGANPATEILDVTPGSIYCSGILFPKKKRVSINPVSEKASTTEGVDSVNDDDDDETSLYDEEDIKQISQRYPDSFGISCCIGKDTIDARDLMISLSGRFYTKLDNEALSHVFVTVESEYLEIVSGLLRKIIQIAGNDGQTKSFSLGDYYSLIDNRLYLSHHQHDAYSLIQEAIKTIEKDCSLFISRSRGDELVKENGLLLATYKERVYERLCSIKRDTVQENSETIRLIEEKETALSFFKDLQSMLSSKGFGFWEAHEFAFNLNLSKVDFSMAGNRTVIHPTVENGLRDIALKDKYGNPVNSKDAKLSVWLQLTKDSRNDQNDNTYLKVLVENTSSHFEETAKLYYSIVTEGVNSRAFFGVRIDVRSDKLVPYKLNERFDSADKEQMRLRQLYRKIDDYGAGHLCSVGWEPKKATHVWSEFLPQYDSPDVDVVPQKVVNKDGECRTEMLITDTSCLQFKRLSTLSDLDDDSVRKELLAFVEAYKMWIDNTLSSAPDASLEEYVEETKSQCLEDYDRIKANISGILSSQKEMLAFRLMNTAMFMQLWHSSDENKEKARNYGASLDENFYREANPEIRKDKGPAAWRPFQLAFILLNLDGLAKHPQDSLWDKRNRQVDLVWFPTGGGKTEAYLGIIAFAILYRRLSNRNGEGTTAIMRYTLRLLATQQFQRALRLILALDQIRQWGTYNLGKQINIGLFVGRGALPNTWSDKGGYKGLKTEGENWNDGKPSKIPFEEKKCPWCGAPMIWDSDKKTLICDNDDCAFEGGLPVLLCDEHIYQTPPTLLFGTVDKFAAIAHKVSNDSKENSRRLFGLNNLTPDLIIQDELHLLEGPLGSAVGLFENAVDTLCTRKGTKGEVIRPKIVSSTATTRNTELQILALYDRNVSVFPKHGLDFDDSFFAFYRRKQADATQYDSKRRYVGILPTGRTAMYTQIRLAACCFTHRALFESEHINELNDPKFIKAADYYYSLISYFNSKKDVGNTDAQFSSEFPKYTRQVFHRVLRHRNMLECFYALNDSFRSCELTGRLNGAQIVSSLGEVQKQWHPDQRVPHLNKKGDLVYGVTPPDLVLATNMISVGIDVSRFNLMIVNSMPRNKSEYIQASSRVARDELGIVFTLHNPYRARDLSHFEKFREFHEKMYFYVDPISITPYSPQAIEKYMPAVLAAILRHKIDELATDADVNKIDEKKVNEIKECVLSIFKTRMDSIRSNTNPLLRELFPKDGLQMIEGFVSKALDEWLARKGTLESYDNPNKSPLFLSLDAYEEEKSQTLWDVPYSLREVAESSVINIKND